MRIRHLWSGVVSLCVVLGISISMAQRSSVESIPRALDPNVIAVRLMLGVGDEASQDWSGRVSVDKGEFRGRDAVVAQKESGIPARLWGFRMQDRPIPRSHMPVLRDRQEPPHTLQIHAPMMNQHRFPHNSSLDA